MNNNLKKGISLGVAALIAGGFITDNAINPYTEKSDFYESSYQTLKGEHDVKFLKEKPAVRVSRWTDDAVMVLETTGGSGSRSLLSDKIEWNTMTSTLLDNGLQIEITNPQKVEFKVDSENLDFVNTGRGLEARHKYWQEVKSDFDYGTGQAYLLTGKTLDRNDKETPATLTFNRDSFRDGFLTAQIPRNAVKFILTITYE